MIKNIHRFIMMGFISIILSSCQFVYINSPQPFDAKSEYRFPKEFCGMWVKNGDTTIISERLFINIEYDPIKSISKKVIDTSSVYLLKNNQIFLVDKDANPFLSEGFPFFESNDSIKFKGRNITRIALSEDAFLRKVEDYYILNITKSTNWWTLYLIKKNADNMIEVSVLESADLKYITNFKEIYSRSEKVFIDGKWSKKEIRDFIEKGGFSTVVLELDMKQKKSIPK